MNPKLRQQRSVFLLFLGACFVCLMAALPIVTAQVRQETATDTPAGKGAEGSAAGGATAPSAAEDAVPFDRADRSRDGRLDREEFARGLQILQVRR